MYVWSVKEGTTQGDPLVMPMYSLATIPLMECLNIALNLKQVWYTDDATASGSLSSLRDCFWLPCYSHKMWVLTKEDHLDRDRKLFGDTLVNITTQGRPHLGAPLGSNVFLCQYVADMVSQWKQELLVEL